MPFAYYGAKHGLASKYPRPRYNTIVEPFAGAAGYSCYHAHHIDRVLLNDLEPTVVATWERLKSMTVADLTALDEIMTGERHHDYLLAGMAGSSAWSPKLGAGVDRAITPRMRGDWPRVRGRIKQTIPALTKFDILNGSYADLPDIEATWFIDPPYQPTISTAGNDYVAGADDIDYAHLAEWCQSRRGQVIVCEQSPAAWLPFTPLARQGNAASNDTARIEVVWLSDQQQLDIFDAGA